MLFWFYITLQTLWPYPLKKCCVRNTEILYSGQQPSSNPVILSSALDISHVQPNHTSVYRPFSLSNHHFDTILRNQRNQLSLKSIILWFSVAFWIRVVKQLLVSRVVSKSAVERSTRMDKTRVYFLLLLFFFFCFLLNDFQLLFIYPRGETDLDKPLIKGLPRYKKAECIPRRTYSDLCSMFLKIVLLSRLLLLVESRFGWALFAGIPNNDNSSLG